MNPQQRETLRNSILLVLDANSTRFGLKIDAITLHVASSFGFPKLRAEAVETEVQYLMDKGFVTEVTKQVSPENCAFRISAEGRDYVAQNL